MFITSTNVPFMFITSFLRVYQMFNNLPSMIITSTSLPIYHLCLLRLPVYQFTIYVYYVYQFTNLPSIFMTSFLRVWAGRWLMHAYFLSLRNSIQWSSHNSRHFYFRFPILYDHQARMSASGCRVLTATGVDIANLRSVLPAEVDFTK